MVDVEPAALLRCTHPAVHIPRVQIAAQLAHLAAQKGDDGRVLQQVVAVRLAALAEGLGFDAVLGGEVRGFERDVAVPGHAGEEDAEGVAPGVEGGVDFDVAGW
jgi:hypothetical protein